MKRINLSPVPLCLSLALLPAPAVIAQTLGETLQRGFTSENIGRAVGAAAGALLGSQIGEGNGKVAAVAIGTLAGFWIGGEVGRHLSRTDRAGIAGTTQQALDTGQAQSWRNPDTGVYTRVSVRDAGAAADRGGLKPRLDQAPPLELMNALYVPDVNLNVRGGPGTDYEILYRLARGQPVPVIGRVVGSDWLMIAGEGSGFVYGPLLSPARDQPAAGNAIRAAMTSGERPLTYAVAQQRCSLITQQVVLPDGTEDRHRFQACQQPDGSWVEI